MPFIAVVAYLKHLLLFAPTTANVHEQIPTSLHTNPRTVQHVRVIRLSNFSDHSVWCQTSYPTNVSKTSRIPTDSFPGWSTPQRIAAVSDHCRVRPSPIPTPKTTTPGLKGRARKDIQKAASMRSKKSTEVRRQRRASKTSSNLQRTIVANAPRKNPVQAPQHVLKRARNWHRRQATVRRMLSNTGRRPTCFAEQQRTARLLHTESRGGTEDTGTLRHCIVERRVLSH